jgi:hypothetical protein
MIKKDLAKTVTGQQPGRKKVYMLYELEPNLIITGGAIGEASA